MTDKKFQIIIEGSIDEEKLAETNLTAEDILNSIVLLNNDVIDGYEITTKVKELDFSLNFFLNDDGKIISKKLIKH